MEPTLEKDARDLDDALGKLFLLRQFRDRKVISGYGISVSQCRAIGVLASHGGISLNRLARELYLDKSTTSRIVDSLERKKYVRRKTDPHDGRALLLAPTDRGRVLKERIGRDLEREARKLIRTLDPPARRTAIRTISLLVQAAAPNPDSAILSRGADRRHLDPPLRP